MEEMRGLSIHITGIVQGVGFRPFVYNLATRLSLTGWVRNTSAGVDIEIEGTPESLTKFLDSLQKEKPPLAKIYNISIAEHRSNGFRTFEIVHSEAIPGEFQPVSPDISICDDCLAELFDPKNKRYLYPFINCTNCGPRFTIIKDLPYDRPNTTMAAFEMCRDCRTEYEDPLDRRFHAQPIACPKCGPNVWLESREGTIIDKGQTALYLCKQLLAEGKIVAIKGLGGFHLACDATNHEAVVKLRERKLRVDKPFAVMMPDISTVSRHCYLDEIEKSILSSCERPIVILNKRIESIVVDEVAPGQKTLGIMLPYTPLHYLLFTGDDKSPTTAYSALVMTSGNFSEEPIVKENEEARKRLKFIADAFLMHDRAIHIRCDDSVVRVKRRSMRNNPEDNKDCMIYPIRRSRGFAPYPLLLPWKMPSILATGGELKNTFCMTKDHYAFLSHHIGDLENLETLSSFEENVSHYEKLFRIKPMYIAHDLHPDYLATRYALTRSASERIPALGIQHHHAHLVACLAENEVTQVQLLDQPVIGIAFDGTGYGEDGAVWGGEVFLFNYYDYKRVYHLEYVPLPGGDKAIREPWRVAIAWLIQANIPLDTELPPVKFASKRAKLDSFAFDPISIIQQQIKYKINSPWTSSVGRLFDAVAAIAGVRQLVNYEAQAAIELETLVDPSENGTYPYEIKDHSIIIKHLIRSLVSDTLNRTSIPIIAARFHNTLALLVSEVAERIRADTDVNSIVLSGGVWQNMVLLEKTIQRLEALKFNVFTHHQVPTNDGGLSLGQAVIAYHKIKSS